jgi:hypothetical protein
MRDIKSRPSFVIIFEDFEYFDSDVLSDIISILRYEVILNLLSLTSHHQQSDNIPFVLVLALSTSTEAIHRLLPQSISSLLCTKNFQLQPSQQYLETIIDDVIATHMSHNFYLVNYKWQAWCKVRTRSLCIPGGWFSF